MKISDCLNESMLEKLTLMKCLSFGDKARFEGDTQNTHLRDNFNDK